MLFDYINEKTCFADGELFHTGLEVREYFTVDHMEYLFGTDHRTSKQELDEMTEFVIQKKWHMAVKNTRVFSVRVNRSDSDEDITQKIIYLKQKIYQFRS